MDKKNFKSGEVPYYTVSLTLVNNTNYPISEYIVGACKTSANINKWLNVKSLPYPLPKNKSITFLLSGYANDIFTFSNGHGTGCQYGFDQNGNFGWQAPCAEVGNGNCTAVGVGGKNYCTSSTDGTSIACTINING